MTAVLSSTNLMEKNIDSDLYDNGEAFCRFLHSTIVGSRVLLLYNVENVSLWGQTYFFPIFFFLSGGGQGTAIM